MPRKSKAARPLPIPRRRQPKPINEEATYRCVLCKKYFGDVVGFNAHHILKFTTKERCLDSHELTALDFKVSKSGVYNGGLLTQILPSQIARLATVRQDVEGPLFSTRATPVPRAI
jgi:hypothetical protein